MNDADLNEKILDEIFKECSDQALEELIDGIPEEDSDDHEFSKEFEAGMEKLFRQERKKESLKRWRKQAPRAAVFFICVLAAACVFVLSVEAVRLRIFNFFIETEEKFSRIDFVEGHEKSQEKNKEADNSGDINIPEDLVLPGYMPDGFEMKSVGGSSGRYMTVYEDDHGKTIVLWQIIFEENGMDGNFSIDMEDTVYEILDINGREVIFMEKNGESVFVWHDESYAFMLTGNIEQKMGCKIVENFQ